MTNRHRGFISLLVFAILIAGVPLLVSSVALAATLPPGFHVNLLATLDPEAGDAPIAMEVIPEGPDTGDMLIAGKAGRLWRIPNGSQTPELVVDLSSSTCSSGEQGLLGIALDPEFGTVDHNYVYLYRTYADGENCRNRVSRFPLQSDHTINPNDEMMLLQTSALGPSNHNGGDIHFGADLQLYISVGDNGFGSNAQRTDNFFGKILRITKLGGIPGGNPLTSGTSQNCAVTGVSTGGAACGEIYAYGLRNPFRFSFNAEGDKFWINDVGEHTWDEVDLGTAGANYGWPSREGRCPTGQSRHCQKQPKRFTPPVHAYNHRIGCDSITGGAVVPTNSNWPVEYHGDYLFADFVCGKVWALDRPESSKRATASLLFEEMGEPWKGIVDMQFDPTDPNRLLYTLYSGEVGAITYSN